MALAPPPSRWQADDEASLLSNQQSHSRLVNGRGPGDSLQDQHINVDTVNNAWRHVKDVAVNDGRTADLYDSLVQAVNEHIDPMPSGWPSLLKPRSPMMAKMPAMIMQRYNACQTVCFCGVFTPISRAWASVDNSLFLWRFDKWNDVPLEYSNEEQAICAVGLVKPRPGVFAEAIQYLLVVCTTTEIVLLGICCSAGNSSDPLNELSIVPLPGYSISSDNITMCVVASTPGGRVFLGGGDGHLYEILYNSTNGWRQKRIVKKDHSVGFTAYLPSFLPSLWHKPTPNVEIVIDEHRHILYTRSQTSAIAVYDLGSESKAANVSQVGEITDLLNSTSYANGSEIFRGRSPADRKGATILHLAVIPPSDSSRLHLVAVTLDGRRVYFTTNVQYPSSSQLDRRPTGLKALICRQAPPSPVPASSRGGSASSRGLSLGAALYSQGMVLLSEAASEGRSRLLVACRDMSIPPLATSTAANATSVALREAVGELEMSIPGETCAIQALENPEQTLALTPNAISDELASQTVSPPPRFVLISTAGVIELERRRPVEILQQMLEERSSSKMEQFFKSYGAAEVAAMCFLLITSTPLDASVSVVQQAKAALENTGLTGLPQIRSDTRLETHTTNTGFDMGQAVPIAEPEWSGAHKGLCLYIRRLLHPIWEETIVRASKTSPSTLNCQIPAHTLQAYETRLRGLEGFLREYQQRRRGFGKHSRTASAFGGPTTSGRTFMEQPGLMTQHDTFDSGHSYPNKRPRLEEAVKQENQRVGWLRSLVMRAAEACFLLGILSDHHMPRLASRLDDSMRQKLLPLTLRDLVCSSTGEAVAAQLISVLVTEHLTATGGVAEELAATLQGGCSSYFKEDDRLYYQASGLLQRAESSSSPADRDTFANQALKLMMKVPLACNLGRIVPQLLYVHAFSGCVELPLRKAEVLDPTNLASNPGAEGRHAREARYEGCYVHVMQVLKFLTAPGATEGEAASVENQAKLSATDRENARKVVLQRASLAEDQYFHQVLYNTLFDLKATKDLLSLDNKYLEMHLKQNGGLSAGANEGSIGPLSPSQVHHLELLAKLYIRRGDALSSSFVYEIMAARKSGVADQSVTLQQRLDSYQNAVLQARAHGDAERVRLLDAKQRTVDLQARLVDNLEEQAQNLQGEELSVMQDTIADLDAEAKDLGQLYNDYACPHSQWALSLEMVALANYDDPIYIKQLWDVYLRQSWDVKRAKAGSGSSKRKAEAGFEGCCTSVERLGLQLYPNETVFPVWHVALRLETTAAGIWPEKGEASESDNRVASAILKACNMSEAAVVRVYDSLLSMRSRDEATENLHLPAVRLRLLRSLRVIITGMADKLQDRQPGFSFGQLHGGLRREAGALSEACQRYATEANRMQGQDSAESLAKEFSSLSARLEKLLAGR